MVQNSTILRSLSGEDVEIYGQICEFVDQVYAGIKCLRSKHGKTLESIYNLSFCCHSIAMAVGMRLPHVRTIHGQYIGLAESGEKVMRDAGEVSVLEPTTCAHSWNMTSKGVIIDCYPVGMIVDAPVIVASSGVYAPFGSGLYREVRGALAQVPERFHHWNQALFLHDLAEMGSADKQ